MNINANTGLYGVAKPHLYYNKAQQQWTCFHWGQGYIMAATMAAAYWRWVELAGLIDKIGEPA